MMIVNKDTNLKNLDNIEVSINSYEDAEAIFVKGNKLAKIADEIRGSALDWVKTHEHERYPDFVADMGINLKRANDLILHSKLVEVAKELGEDAPTKAASSVKLPGKTPEAKLDSYHKVQEETGKEEPNRKDIENYKKKLSEKNHDSSNIRKNYNEDEIIDVEIDGEEVAKLKAELKKVKATLKKRNAEIKELKAHINLTTLDAVREYVDAYTSLFYIVETVGKAKPKQEQFSLDDWDKIMEADSAYQTLGLEAGVEFKEIKSRWAELMKEHHPDRNGGDSKDGERLSWIQDAYDILKRLHRKGLLLNVN